MNAHTKAIQIATEIGKPGNVDMIEAQLARKEIASKLSVADRIALDDSLRMAEAADSARRVTAYCLDQSKAEQRLIDVKAATRALNDEQKVRLAIFVLDGVDRISTDLRVEAESVLADILSGVRT